MDAVRFFGTRDVRWESVPRARSVDGNQVRVRVLAGGICGSDLHVYETGSYVTQIPVTMGHEFCGEVSEIGPDVVGVDPFDHVVGDSRVACGRCPHCLEHESNLCDSLGFLGEVCDGAFAEEIVLPFRSVVKISPDVPSDVAALAEPLAVCLHALGRAELSSSSKILILGGGPIGALLSTVLLIRGFTGVHIAERSEYRRKVLGKLGLGRVLEQISDTYDALFETTGSAHVLSEVAPAHLAKSGKATVVGIYREAVPFNFTDLVEREWQIVGSSVFSGELPGAVALLERDWRRFQYIVTHRFPLRCFQQAFDLVLAPQREAMKVLLLPGGQKK